MVKTIYVGNLPYTATDDDLRTLFGEYGEIKAVKLITDRDTGRPRGFGFVEIDPAEADAAVAALNGQDYGGRTLRINEARARHGGPRMRRTG